MRVDSIIVQFIKTPHNRALLGRFVWAYFNRVCHTPFGCSSCHRGHCNVPGRGSDGGGCVEEDPSPLASPILTSLEYADHLLSEIVKLQNMEQRQQQRCQCSIPPLYLQWEGHSVTVVGVKRSDCTSSTIHGHLSESSPSELFSLIIFCPQKNVINVKSALTKEFHLRTVRDKGMVDSHEYRSNKRKKVGNNNNNTTSILELPVTKLLQQDCQILLTTGRTIDEAESKRRTVCSNGVGFLNAIAR